MVSGVSLLNEITITNTRPEHGAGIYDTVRLAYSVRLTESCRECIDADDVREQLQRFPEGQFVALHRSTAGEKVVGMASTMRTGYPPDKPPLSWLDAIGDLGIANHEPDGEWLYGVEMAVRPDYRKRGIGTALYEARFELVRKLNLKGWYAVGMLMGYHRLSHKMSVREYGERVIRGDLIDPTVTMQMNRGFEPISIVEDYLDEPDAGDAGVLILWKNSDYFPVKDQDI